MTVSEFTFLALGLILGLASGVAFIEIVRARPPAHGEVRVTVAVDAIPRRRAATLAEDAFITVSPEPARGGPADRRTTDPASPQTTEHRRTNVQSDSGGSPLRAYPRPTFMLQPRASVPDASSQAAAVAMDISSGEDPAMGALRASSAAAAARAGLSAAQGARQTAIATLDGVPGAPPGNAVAPSSVGRCAEERRIADERCELATRARARADEAAETLRVAQRSADSHEKAAAEAADRMNPGTVRAAKEDAQRTFRAATRAAASRDGVESAARDWLLQINRINAESRDATASVSRDRAAANEIGATLERLSLEADAARIGADTAEATCTTARVAVAECDERRDVGPGSATVTPAPAVRTPDRLEMDQTLAVAMETGGSPRIFRLLGGDPTAMATVVEALAAADPGQAPHWALMVAQLIDAIVADAIDAGALAFPPDDPFWGPFNRSQCRDIVRALGSLGYRFDGRGGWLDERVPSQRDLSLALGYAGLDPMRVRHWPDEAASRELLSQVQVTADEYLAGNAGELTLGEMVTMLGRRADGLAELWNQWGKVRPLLLQEA